MRKTNIQIDPIPEEQPAVDPRPARRTRIQPAQRNQQDIQASEYRVTLWDKVLVCLGYLFFITVFNIIFTDRRKSEYLSLHAAQAFFYWIFVAVIAMSIRMIVFSILSNNHVPLIGKLPGYFLFAAWMYSIWCCLLFMLGRQVRIPVVSVISGRLA